MIVLLIILSFILDVIIGDPYNFPHPIKLIGNYIYFIKKKVLDKLVSKKSKYVCGGLLWLSTIIGTIVITWGVLKLSYDLNHYLGHVVFVYLSYTCLATKCLANEAKKVASTLENGTIEEARKQVSMIVGRQTDQLTEEEIAKATIETVAENTSDGVIAPLFYLFLGGPVLAMAYKAVNTLDSMVGYLTPEYKEIGYVSAKMDDLWNIIPARVSFILMCISSLILRMKPQKAFQIGLRDCKKHKSPNGGYLEAPASGALGIQLGGSHMYHGIEIYKPTIGEALKTVDFNDILRMNRLMYGAAWIGLVIFSIVYYLVFIILN